MKRPRCAPTRRRTTESTPDAGPCWIEIVGEDGIASDLKEKAARLEGEANEESMLSKRTLRAFLKKQAEEAEF